MPTVCISFRDDQDDLRETCVHEPTPLPTKYGKLAGGLAYDALWHEATKEAGAEARGEARGGSDSSDPETEWVKIHIAPGHDSTDVVDLLEDNGVTAEDFSSTVYGYVRGRVPVSLLTRVSQLESVDYIEPIIELPLP